MWCVIISLAALCVALALAGDDARYVGRYERAAIEAGEYWRLASAHVVHLGWGHLWPNLAALLLLGVLFDGVLDASAWLLAVLASIVAIDTGLYLVDTHLLWYVGLSGVLHGIVAAGAFALLIGHSGLGAAIAIVLCAKLAYEQIFGPMPFTETSAGGPVIVAAHVYGAAGGFLSALGTFLFRGRRRQL